MLKHPEVTIRFAQKEDLPQIIGLCEAHARFEQAAYHDENQLERLDKQLFGPDPGLKCLILAQQHTPVGYATFMKQFSTWEADWYLYLDCLYLQEQVRGQGFGKLIMEKIKEHAISEKCKIIQWQTPAFNQPAIHFYQGIGANSRAKERFFWLLDK